MENEERRQELLFEVLAENKILQQKVEELQDRVSFLEADFRKKAKMLEENYEKKLEELQKEHKRSFVFRKKDV